MKTFSLPIVGMTCHRCTAAVERALGGVSGVKSVHVLLDPAIASVESDDSVSREALVRAVSEAGYRADEATAPPPVLVSLGGLSPPVALEVAPRPSASPESHASPHHTDNSARTLTFDVRGMHCASCTARVEDAARSISGVESAHVNLATGQAYIRARETVDATELVAAISAAGYESKPSHNDQSLDAFRDDRTLDDRALWFRQFVLALVFLVGGIALHYGLSHSSTSSLLALAWSIVGAGVVGWPFASQAARILRSGGANMDSLVVLGLIASIAAGALSAHGESMALMDGQMILAAVTLGRWLEARAKSSAWSKLRAFAQSVPQTAMVERGTRIVDVPVRSVHLGETIVVHPGERIPLDSIVVDGQSEADESWLTGESLPAGKQPGDRLLAGTTNGSGALKAKVTSEASTGVWNAAADRMREALVGKSQWQRLADQVIRWFVPGVLLLAGVTLAGWLLAGSSFSTALFHAASVLVAACPCAMGLATPVALVVASGRAASRGIVFKNLQSLERAERIDTVMFDKTGTLTTGKLTVRAVEPYESLASSSRQVAPSYESFASSSRQVAPSYGSGQEAELLRVASAVETLAAHPAARAIVAEARRRNLSWPIADRFRTLPGRGALAFVDGVETLAVNAAEMRERGIPFDLESNVGTIGTGDPLRVHIAQRRDNEWRALGRIVLEDSPRAESQATVAELKQRGNKVLLVSGDRETTARTVGDSLGIADVYAEVTPSGKLEIVKRLQAEGRRIAVVGDGVNDAPALAAADLGIALGSGTDLAIEAADVALPGNNLQSVGESLLLAHRTGAIIRQNLAWAFGYNVLLLPIATGALEPLLGLSLTPAMSAAAMAASSICVVLNSLRLR